MGARAALLVINCLVCGSELKISPSRIGIRKHCSYKCRWGNIDKEEAIRLYKSGLSSRDVAKIMGVDSKSILNWAKEVGYRRSISESQTGERHHQYGKPISEATKQKMSAAQKGRKLSIKHKEKLSLAKKGKPQPSHLIGLTPTKGKPLSEDHRRKIGEANKGEKSTNWKGGVTPEYKRLRKSVDFKLWREQIFARDNWTCQNCGQHGRDLEPHHVKPFALYPELRFDVGNGMTLCVACHKEIDEWRN